MILYSSVSLLDTELRDNLDRFCRQEAQHYMQHERFNALVVGHDYPGLEARIARLRADFEDFLNHHDDRFRIGFIEGFEANTTQGALFLLRSGLFEHPQTQPDFGLLFKWHMLEEIEHRNIAFDVYQHLYGTYWYRARMCWYAQRHMHGFIGDCTKLMVTADVPRHGERCRVSMKERLLRPISIAVPRVVSMLPGYTPHKYDVPQRVGALSTELSALAESAS
ncbi:MAG: metal-dependent hydrolase [Gammaproteobacteria bacterium]|nr:metal-dependent hydrolase [Gammaproteobacteria bacterium]